MISHLLRGEIIGEMRAQKATNSDGKMHAHADLTPAMRKV